MKAASIGDIKKELSHHDREEVLEYCMRLAKFKKENKEMLSFLLFESHDISGYIAAVNNETKLNFSEMNTSNIYFIKKSLRKILRNVNKKIRFAMSKEVEAELLIYFCNCFVEYSIPIEKSRQIHNLYTNQLKKIEKLLEQVHSDLQYDFKKKLMGKFLSFMF